MVKKRILVVMDGFFPGEKFGGPPVSVNNFCSLMSEYEVYIVTKDHDLNSAERYESITDGWNERENCYVKYLSDSDYGIDAFRKIVNEVKPDFIYLQSLFQSCVLPCLIIAKRENIRAILAPRGELCKGAFRKKYKKIPYIICLRLFGLVKNVCFQSTCDEESEAIMKYLGAKNNNVHLLTNIPSCVNADFPYKVKESGSAKFIFLSRIHPKKNLLGAISFFKNIKGNVTFDIYGPIEDGGYWHECENIIKTLPDNIKVNYRGLVTHDKTHSTFNKYDAFVFPTFSENFGHVIAEALSSKCPVIISDQTPWNDVSEYKAGFSFSLDDTCGFTNAIQSIVDSDNAEMSENAKEFINSKYNFSQLKKEYTSLFTL